MSFLVGLCNVIVIRRIILCLETPLKRKRLCSRGDSEDTSASVPSSSHEAAPLSKAEKPAPRSKRSFSSVDTGDEQASCSKDCIGPSSSSGLCSKASSSSEDEEAEASREVPEVAQGQKAVPTPAKEKQTPIDSVVKNVEVIFRLLKK